ncbi:hypothetical protein IFM89_029521 [Coptis chinensis]|uniref:Protein FAR1-RELATED SEQUENCE n=1 Tax=Coptis chinensis TaxID=261450 RepID=A0A835H0I9_9MAGN|nr:hypothetical protein IFM89_029521 [Coptis chinensis]
MLDGLTPLVMLTDADAALMKALEVISPQVTKLLCRFHINMNVAHRARKELPNVESCQKFSSLWDRLVSSTIEAEVEWQWNYIVKKFKEFPDLIDYLQNTWMPCREKFVDAWSDRCVNFGEKTTNRAEGAHASLKRSLNGRKNHTFLNMWELIHPNVAAQVIEIRASFEA